MTPATRAALADRLEDPLARWDAYAQRLLTALEEGNLARLRECHALARAALAGIPLASGQWVSVFNDAWQTMLRGDLVEAALHVGVNTGQPDALTIYGIQLAKPPAPPGTGRRGHPAHGTGNR